MITGLGSAKDLASGKRGAFYNTLEEFSKYWERIDIICPRISRGSLKGGSTSRDPEVEPPRLLFGNVYLHISPWPLIFHPLWFLKKGIEIYKNQKFDLMTVQEFPPFYNGIGARLLWQFIRVPYVLEIHHIPGYPRAASAKEEIYRSLTKLFIEYDAKKAKAVRVVNQNQAPKFLIEAGVPKEKIVYIPSVYLDTEIFRPMNLSKEYDLIFIGRLESNKGINLFLETVKKLNCKATIVGDGSLKKELQANSYNLQANILFHGWAKDPSEIAELLNKSKILVMPSYNEGGPRVVVEALACGLPVLATEVGIVPDLANTNKPGLIKIGWDAEDISQKAGELLSNDNYYQEQSRGALELARPFEKKTAINNYAQKLQSLISN